MLSQRKTSAILLKYHIVALGQYTDEAIGICQFCYSDIYSSSVALGLLYIEDFIIGWSAL